MCLEHVLRTETQSSWATTQVVVRAILIVPDDADRGILRCGCWTYLCWDHAEPVGSGDRWGLTALSIVLNAYLSNPFGIWHWRITARILCIILFSNSCVAISSFVRIIQRTIDTFRIRHRYERTFMHCWLRWSTVGACC